MAKKNHYYVLVCTSEGAKFVTRVGEHHTAFWDVTEPPQEFSKTYAEDMVNGLMWNGHIAYLVVSPIEYHEHPYNYAEWECEWKKKSE